MREQGIIHATSKSSGPKEVQSLARRRILIVDDNVDGAESLGTLLELHGGQVDIAHDGQTALSKARSFRPEVLIIDIDLPDMDGYEVACRVRNDFAAMAPLIVALTGYGYEETRARSAEAGFDAHLVKPLDFTTAIDLIASKLRRSASPPKVLGTMNGWRS